MRDIHRTLVDWQENKYFIEHNYYEVMIMLMID